MAQVELAPSCLATFLLDMSHTLSLLAVSQARRSQLSNETVRPCPEAENLRDVQ